MINILFTCAGRRNYIIEYFRDALKECGGSIFAANSDQNSSALLVADKGFVVPSIYDPSYIDIITRICEKYGINAIIPLFDLELPILAKSKHLFKDLDIDVIVSAPEVINVCNDKSLTNNFIEDLGFPVLPTYLDLPSAIEALSDGAMKFPVIIKPRWGMGSIGLFEADSFLELEFNYTKAQSIIENSYLSTQSNQDRDKSVLIQEKVIGTEYGLDVINDLNGKYQTTFIKRKIRMRSGETDCAVTEDKPELCQLGKTIGEELQHVVNLDVDVITNEDGAYIIEMNPRFGGGYPFSHLAGANIPKAILSWLRGEKPDASNFEIAYNVTSLKGVDPMVVNAQNFTFF